MPFGGPRWNWKNIYCYFPGHKFLFLYIHVVCLFFNIMCKCNNIVYVYGLAVVVLCFLSSLCQNRLPDYHQLQIVMVTISLRHGLVTLREESSEDWQRLEVLLGCGWQVLAVLQVQTVCLDSTRQATELLYRI